jgi:hypothetical protein
VKLTCAVRSSSRYASLQRWQAWLVLGATVALLVGCSLLASSRLIDSAGIQLFPLSDTQRYRQELARLHAGENYYEVTHQELTAGGYAVITTFNWRLPLWAWMMAGLPEIEWARWLLIGCCYLTAGLGAAVVLRDCGLGCMVGFLVLLAGAFVWAALYDNFASHELWSGMLVALSVASLGLGWRWLGVAAGLLALFFRELALVYVVVATAQACWEGRRREGIVWLGGLALFGVALALHHLEVSRRVADLDRVGADWFEWHGLHFVLWTCRMNTLVGLLPYCGSALYLVLGLLGLAGWRGPTGVLLALTCFGYVAAFCIVGKLVNFYWGAMYAPLLAFGVVRAPGALRDLFIAARGRRPVPLTDGAQSATDGGA